jgi:LacI family transcriptional regulator
MTGEPRDSDDSRATVVSLFAELDAELAATDELRSRTEALAESPSLEREAGRYLIGLITAVYEVSELAHPFFGRVFMGARGRLDAGGCDLLLCAARPARPGDPLRAGAVERTINRGVDAMIVWGVGNNDPELGRIIASGVPSVFIDHDPLGERVAHVMSDNVDAMAKVVDHLYEGGRRRIAHIAGLQNTRPGLDRLFGYRSELSQLGLPGPDGYIEQGDYYHHSAREATERLLQMPEPPDAITCASDMMAIGAMFAIEEAGLRVPHDIAVTGFDDAEFATRLSPTLTTVRQDAFGLGTAAAEALLRMLANPDDPPRVVVLPAELVVRESSGPPAAKRQLD